MNRTRVVQRCLDQIRGGVYLEIGLSLGLNFSAVRAPTKIGVDPAFLVPRLLQRRARHRAGEVHYFRMTSDEFFESHKEWLALNGIGVAFIDGLHTYEQSLRDVEHCLQHLQEGGVIVLHDCSPRDASIATPAASYGHFRRQHRSRWIPLRFDPRHLEWSGDVWKTVVRLRSARPDLDVAVLDCDHGVGLVKKGTPERPLSYLPHEIESMTYADLAEHRGRLLNLREPSCLREFLGRS